MSVESLLFHPVVALQFSPMEREISHVKWARLLSRNQIREIVMDSDSDEEKCYASEDMEDEEPHPPSRRSSISQPPSPDFSTSSSEVDDDLLGAPQREKQGSCTRNERFHSTYRSAAVLHGNYYFAGCGDE
jgi:hypothetical protein